MTVKDNEQRISNLEKRVSELEKRKCFKLSDENFTTLLKYVCVLTFMIGTFYLFVKISPEKLKIFTEGIKNFFNRGEILELPPDFT